jgi:membrane protein YqaA with SNARE-associated domain
VDMDGPQVRRLRRWGAPALVLSFVPLVGDALVLAAGWLRMPFWPSLFWIAIGKGTRYLLVVLGMLGVLKFA